MKDRIVAGKSAFIAGVNATCDSFYSSQGRNSSHFYDENALLLSTLRVNQGVRTLDMESFYLFHLARDTCIQKAESRIHAADLKFIVANRTKNEFMVATKETQVQKDGLEAFGSQCCLEALVEFDPQLHP